MIETDLVVLGSGAGGLAAAVTGAASGLDVIVAEKTEYLGGTMALSGGGLWLPCNPYMKSADSKDRAKQYLRNVVGNRFQETLIDAFLENAPKMVRFLETNTRTIRFFAADFLPDYEPAVEGATPGRTMSMAPIDAAELGSDFVNLRPPLRQLTALGGMQIDAADLEFLLSRWRSMPAFIHTAKMVLRQGADWVRSGRGRVLKSGNGVAARMIKAARDCGVEFHRSAPAVSLIERDGRVAGAILKIDGKETQILARRGVVIATGGFAQDPELSAKYMPFPDEHISMLPMGNTGDGIRLGESVGGALGEALPSNGCWTPVSVLKNADGTQTAYPHIFLDRSRPGSIIVDGSGKRFVNEATHYQALVSRIHEHGTVPCWLIASKAFVGKYGLGLVRPYERIEPYARSGYLVEGRTPAELAQKLGMEPARLEATFTRVDADARTGKDSQFHRGESVYDQVYGDHSHPLNPNFGALGDGPFYAVRVTPGDLGTFVGLVTDEYARVLRQGAPVPGLYAAGLDAQSIMGGCYPGAGSMLGPAFTFGFIAAQHAAQG